MKKHLLTFLYYFLFHAVAFYFLFETESLTRVLLQAALGALVLTIMTRYLSKAGQGPTRKIVRRIVKGKEEDPS